MLLSLLVPLPEQDRRAWGKMPSSVSLAAWGGMAPHPLAMAGVGWPWKGDLGRH